MKRLGFRFRVGSFGIYIRVKGFWVNVGVQVRD